MKRATFCLLLLALCASRAQAHPERMIPLVLAEPAVQAALEAFPESRESRYGFIDGYCEAFLDHWRHCARISAGRFRKSFTNAPRTCGYAEGNEALPDQMKKTHVTPLDFGYTLQTLTGTFTQGFEKKQFTVAATNEKIWLSRGLLRSLPADREITISAFVSPLSRLGFGHMNQWKRELIVVKRVEQTDEIR